MGIKHWHLRMDGPKQTNFAGPDELQRIKADVNELFKYLVGNEEKALLHCAAGYHRTGMISYTLLRLSGLDPDEAF